VNITPLELPGAFEVRPSPHSDHRGSFLEWYRSDQLAAHLGFEPRWLQANLSSTRAGVIRGVHVTTIPPGQAKYVTCVRGSVFDVIVDMRVGSPTYGKWAGTLLDDVDRKALYLGEGLGHGLCALTDDATVAYLCTEVFDGSAERAMTPLDPDVAIAWPVPSPVLSEKDAGAATLAQLCDEGKLPTWADYQALGRTRA
jgi:dTDP-4-dehydrorhamnose 3,5-epimerase